jgi:hypothetical protein
MSFDFILVSGPLVRASSLEPTAVHLREAGYDVQVPDVLAYHQPPPSWNEPGTPIYWDLSIPVVNPFWSVTVRQVCWSLIWHASCHANA